MTTFTRAVALASVLVLGAGVAHAEGPMTFAEAKSSASEAGKPLLIDFFATWCGPCKAFDAACKENEALKTALADNVVLFKIDAEKGDGIELARRYDVTGFPTYVLMNTEGVRIDSWYGFAGAEWFIEKMEGAVADPSTVREKISAFSQAPTKELAVKLAEIASTRGHYGDAIAYYRRAESMDSGASYAGEILEAISDGSRYGLFVDDDIVAQAERVLALDSIEPDALLKATLTVRALASKDRSHLDAYLPFLESGMKVVDEASADLGAYAKRNLSVDHALFVEQNADHAIELKKATYADGWMDDAGRLNSFAWWCFENSINLGEAEELARKAVELAPEGRERAQVIDTLAEICNLKGDCGEAVELMKQAIATDPNNAYWKKQLARFEELLAKQS